MMLAAPGTREHEALTVLATVLFAFIAGSAFLFTAAASASIPAASLTAMRMLLGSTALIVFHTACWGPRATMEAFISLLGTRRALTWRIGAVGILNTTLPYTLYAVASTHGVDVSVMAILSATSPLFASILAWLFIPGTEPICRARRVLGLSMALSGGLFVALRKDLRAQGGSLRMSRTSAEGVAAQLLAVLCKSSAAILAEHTLKLGGGCVVAPPPQQLSPVGHSPALENAKSTTQQLPSATTSAMTRPNIRAPSLAMVQACCGAAFAVPLAWLWDFYLFPSRGQVFWTHSDDSGVNWPTVVPALLYLGVVCSCFVYFLQFFVIQRAGGVRQIVGVDCLVPAVGVAEGAMFLCDFCGDSQLSIALAMSGAALCIFGVALFHSEVNMQSQVMDSNITDRRGQHGASLSCDEHSDGGGDSDGGFEDPFCPSNEEAALANPLLDWPGA
mmetsp:Transcript_30315/g.61748  ORF Transcript_30315/g.61748 Transcript_30315/m.61748 type:complete len:446 (-) Transcript_30315:140-1477(-)